ncbi:MAG: PHP domain-containing protein [Bacillota bacterium]|nr:PHP domain-containing protein [Bacillota bacterium]
MYDLHVHTTASDGTLTPEEVLLEANRIGLNGLAITDHDTVDGLQAAKDLIHEKGIEIAFIPGIEMNSELDEEEIHILGYFIDDQNKAMESRLQEIVTLRKSRAEAMVEKLKVAGLDLSFELVQRYAGGALVGRPHIARAMIHQGYVNTVSEAFRLYLGKGRPGYVPRYKFLPNEAIELIKNAGGVLVLAHPGLIKSQENVLRVIKMGMEGIEVYYPKHSTKEIKNYLALATEKKLLITGGSDFHGPGSSEDRNALGSAGIGEDNLQRLMEYHALK